MSFCGLECDTCLILLATKESDPARKAEMRLSIAHELSEVYKTVPKPEIISDCDGCKTSGGRLFTGCTDCAIRKCATGKKLSDCAHCVDYACDVLLRHFIYDPGSRIRLDELHREIFKSS
jgi:hypothetical protein